MLEVKKINLKIKNNLLFSGEFKAFPGQITVIKGEIGSGKTTFYNNLFHLNFDVWICHKKQVDKRDWHKKVAYVHQDVQQYNDLTFQELSDCFCFDKSIGFEDMGIEFVPSKKIKLCSEGEKQRISLLVALWKKPSILILDEPTSFLDKRNQKRVLELVKEYTIRRKCITILSTHYDLDDEFENCHYDITNRQLILKKSEPSSDSLSTEITDFNLSKLMKWIQKNIISKIRNLILLIFSLSLLFVGVTSYQLNQATENWFNTNGRYALSYSDFNLADQIYCKECVIEVNGEFLVIGLMNYYDGMNMYTKDNYQTGDIIVNDALRRKLINNNINIDNHDLEITNVMKADMNKELSPYRYMIYVPNDIFWYKEGINPLYYVIVYESEAKLIHYQKEITSKVDYININSLEEQYTDFTSQTKGYHNLLKVVPLILGVVLNLLRLILERKYDVKLNWPSWYGLSRKDILKLYSRMFLVLFVMASLVVIVFINRNISLWVGIPYLIYIFLEIILFMRKSI